MERGTKEIVVFIVLCFIASSVINLIIGTFALFNIIEIFIGAFIGTPIIAIGYIFATIMLGTYFEKITKKSISSGGGMADLFDLVYHKMFGRRMAQEYAKMDIENIRINTAVQDVRNEGAISNGFGAYVDASARTVKAGADEKEANAYLIKMIADKIIQGTATTEDKNMYLKLTGKSAEELKDERLAEIERRKKAAEAKEAEAKAEREKIQAELDEFAKEDTIRSYNNRP